MSISIGGGGNHHVFDCFVRVKQIRTENGIRQEREVLVRPVLTAWMDTASGCIVGWVISIMPNATTIAEACCRAVVYTCGDSFHGLPSSILVDCRKDYHSALLEDIPVDMENSIPEDRFLNRRFSGMGILPALNVTFTWQARQALIPIAFNKKLGGISSFTKMIGRAITHARAAYFTSDGRCIPEQAKCFRPSIREGTAYPWVSATYTLPITPDRIVIDEYLISTLLADFKAQCKPIKKKNSGQTT